MNRGEIERGLEEERRAVVFGWLDQRLRDHGDLLDFPLLAEGVPFRAGRQPILHRQKGIYKPAGSPVALSLKTSIRDQYGDRFDDRDTLIYRMERSGPEAEDNRSARRAFEEGLPLIYFRQESKGPPATFTVVHPVWIVGVDLPGRSFRVETAPRAASDVEGTPFLGETPASAFERALQRRYSTRLIRTRLHQAAFRERVLGAYRSRCAMCRLRERALLDAAHIDPDSDPVGEARTSNGIALCRIHHAAFDAHLLSIEPRTLKVHVQPRLLRERDGPMLDHGLKALQERPLEVPSAMADRPDAERLARHWERFRGRVG